jgi:hypothetical protein
MTTNPQEQSEAIIRANKRAIDRALRTLQSDMEHENTLVAETPLNKLQKVLKIYRSIKPLLAVLGTLPLIPSMWRGTIVIFGQALDALAASAPDVTAQFKAGKDI